jgi:hypothetical protein
MTPDGTCERLWVHRGLFCLAVGWYELGTRCGYVMVPTDHPWHGVDKSDPVKGRDVSSDPVVMEDLDIIALMAMGEDWLTSLAAQVNVHGGLTFSDERDWNEQLENHDGIPVGWWLGFDAGHAWDARDLSLVRGPHAEDLKRMWSHLSGGRAWTTEDIVSEVERLAGQVALAYEVKA